MPPSHTPLSPGHGNIHLTLLPPSTPTLRTLSYQYPLKLISPRPLAPPSNPASLVHTVFLLTYGGGLVAGDAVHLNVRVEGGGRLVMLTQGSTKVFKATAGGREGMGDGSGSVAGGGGGGDVIGGNGNGERSGVCRQRIKVRLEGDGGVCYLPDPVQPFRGSMYEGSQVYELLMDGGVSDRKGEDAGAEAMGAGPSLCVCDWVSEGRTARGEKWDFWRYGSRNEVWSVDAHGKRRLLLRDNLVLDEKEGMRDGVAGRVDGLGVFGTLIIRGPMFEGLGRHLMNEFEQMPRIGGRKWDGSDDGKVEMEEEEEVRRRARQKREAHDGVLWTAAMVRGFVLVKFGAREVEGARVWLNHMLKAEGSVERNFGERALLCLR